VYLSICEKLFSFKGGVYGFHILLYPDFFELFVKNACKLLYFTYDYI